MIDHLIHEITVVADHDDTTREVLQVLLEDLECHDVEVIGWLIEHQEVGVTHEHGAEVELTTLTTAELIDIVMLLFGGEQEILQELRGSHPTTTHVNVVSNIGDNVNHLLLFIEMQSFLREISEAYGIANDDMSLVRLYLTQQHLDECRFTCAVIAHDTHLLEAGEVIVEVLEQHELIKAFRDVLTLEDLTADIDIRSLQTQLALFQALLGNFLKLVERILTILRLMTTSLRHATHPLQFRAIEVIGTSDLCTTGIDTLLTFLQVVGVVATIGIELTVIELQDAVAYTIEEITVVCDHEQGFVATLQESLQPLDHLQVEMVCGLIEDEQVWFGDQDICQCHTFLLSSRELSHGLLEVAYLQLCQYLLGLEHFLVLTVMIETRIKHTLVRIEVRRLFQDAHTQITAEDDVTTVVPLMSGKNGEERGFSCSVLCYQSYTLSFTNAEADVLEEHEGTKRLSEMLDV